jgi:hypothetical protein
MAAFLFWNLNKRSLSARLVRLAAVHDLDFILLAESRLNPRDLCAALSAAGGEYFFPQTFHSGKLQVYARRTWHTEDAMNTPRFTIRRIRQRNGYEYNLVVAHLPSAIDSNLDSRNQGIAKLRREILTVEHETGHRRTIVVGDFNMNPFDAGIVGCEGLHAVMTTALASRRTRTVGQEQYPFFFNPMWSHFGERSTHPAGSYFYPRAELVCQFWHVYDQVLIRPDLIGALRSVRLLSHDGTEALVLEDGRPDHKTASDHLPLYFELNI